jgi:predicted aminopeptidase
MRFPDQFQQTWREKLQNCSKILSYRIFKETFIFKQYFNIIAVCKKSLKQIFDCFPVLSLVQYDTIRCFIYICEEDSALIHHKSYNLELKI